MDVGTHHKLAAASSSKLISFGNIYRSRARILPAASLHHHFGKVHARRHIQYQHSEDLSTMTNECMRARLVAERSAAKAAKLKIEELEKKVQRLERNLRTEIHRRKIAETALQDSLEKMLSSGESSCMSTDSELDTLTSGEALSQAQTIEATPTHSEAPLVPLERGVEKSSASKVLRLPCAASLDPHIHNSDSSDWSEDDDDQELLNSSAIVISDENTTLPYKLHLSQLDLARKIGRSLKEWKTSCVQNCKTGNQTEKQVTQGDSKHEEQPQGQIMCVAQSPSDEEGVPYVSFSKYLGVNRYVAVGVDDGVPGTTLWQIKDQSGSSNNERIDEILHALSFLKISV